MRTEVPRLAFIDALKAIASQLVVLHHLALYGPMSDVARQLAPSLLGWLTHEARVAVQIFLVIGGFLAAKALAPCGQLVTPTPLSLLKKRYFKLVIPYLAAVLLSILCAAIARNLIEHDSIPNAPTLWQLMAHIALLQSLLDFDSLSAGVWYIAIDFQLFGLMLGLLWLARWLGKSSSAIFILGVLLVSGVILASLFHFNRHAGWDSWAVYFFGSYGLGALTYWATEAERKPDGLLLITAVVIAALIIDFRSRIALALLTALILGISRRWGFLENRPQGALLAYLGKISYSVFLVHFSVVILFNAVFSHLSPENPVVNALGIVLAWAASIAAGALFFRQIESRVSQWQTVLNIQAHRLLERVALVFKAK